MRRADAVRKVYRELRHSLGETFSASETLELAHALVETSDDTHDEPRFSLRTGKVPFDELGLDKVFEDGGWRVLARMYREDMERKQRESDELKLHKRFLQWKIESTKAKQAKKKASNTE